MRRLVFVEVVVQPAQPSVTIAGDSPDRIMARSGAIVGHSATRYVWRFGFLPQSDSAKAYGVASEQFHWVLADRRGRVLAKHDGFGVDLPKRFRDVIALRRAKKTRSGLRFRGVQ